MAEVQGVFRILDTLWLPETDSKLGVVMVDVAVSI